MATGLTAPAGTSHELMNDPTPIPQSDDRRGALLRRAALVVVIALAVALAGGAAIGRAARQTSTGATPCTAATDDAAGEHCVAGDELTLKADLAERLERAPRSSSSAARARCASSRPTSRQVDRALRLQRRRPQRTPRRGLGPRPTTCTTSFPIRARGTSGWSTSTFCAPGSVSRRRSCSTIASAATSPTTSSPSRRR